jgi:hypothetical protein
MVLAYGEYQSSLRMDAYVAESEGTLGCYRLRLTIASNGVEAPIAEL